MQKYAYNKYKYASKKAIKFVDEISKKIPKIKTFV